MSTDFIPIGSCLRKDRYTSKQKALNVLKLMNRKPDVWFGLHEYHCPHCNGYHLGHKQQKQRELT